MTLRFHEVTGEKIRLLCFGGMQCGPKVNQIALTEIQLSIAAPPVGGGGGGGGNPLADYSTHGCLWSYELVVSSGQ